MYMLDTDTCIYIAKNHPPQVHKKFQAAQPGDITISSITYAELMNGAFKSQRIQENLQKLRAFSSFIEVLPFNAEASEIYGEIRSHLEKNGNIIGSYDLLIAAHALAENKILITNNKKEFKRAPNLITQNWIKTAAFAEGT